MRTWLEAEADAASADSEPHDERRSGERDGAGR